jgi:hypothetical protein
MVDISATKELFSTLDAFDAAEGARQSGRAAEVFGAGALALSPP